jgi:hypothetical protein
MKTVKVRMLRVVWGWNTPCTQKDNSEASREKTNSNAQKAQMGKSTTCINS